MNEEIEQPVEQPVEQEVEIQEGETDVEASEETETSEAVEASDDGEEARKEEARKRFAERESRREELERLKRENEHLRAIAQQQPVRSQEVSQPQRQYIPDPDEPKLDAYFDAGKTAEEWSRDHRAYLDYSEAKKREVYKVHDDVASRLKKYSKVNKDIFKYEVALSKMVTPELAKGIINCDNLGEVVEALALDEDKVYALNQIRDPFKLSRELLKLEASLKKKPSISGAPKPITSVKGTITNSGIDLADISQDEYRKYRNSQRR
jgi:hypothetical protein